MQNKKRRSPRLYERIANFCEVPEELVARIPVFVIRGRHEIEISGADGISEYTDRAIVITVGRDKFTVRGEHLVLADFRESVIYVRGNIDSASFEGGVN